jgi:hypothetical protein
MTVLKKKTITVIFLVPEVMKIRFIYIGVEICACMNTLGSWWGDNDIILSVFIQYFYKLCK